MAPFWVILIQKLFTRLNSEEFRNCENTGSIGSFIATHKIKTTCERKFRVCEYSIMTRLNSEQFKIIIFEPKLSFSRKNKKIINRMNFQIFTNSSYVLYFEISHKIGQEKMRKSYRGWIRKNPRIHPSFHFCELTTHDLKMKILKVYGIQPRY